MVSALPCGQYWIIGEVQDLRSRAPRQDLMESSSVRRHDNEVKTSLAGDVSDLAFIANRSS